MANAAVEWHVHCDVPTYRQVDISSDGVAWQACIVSGWLPFTAYLAALGEAVTAYATGTWVFELVVGADDTSRVRIRKTSGTTSLTFRFQSPAMAALLGFEDLTTGPPASSHMGTLAPDGYLDAYGVSWENPRDAADTEVTEFRHGRTFSAPWGSGTIFDIDIAMSWVRATRLVEGPCRRGKVRLADTTFSSGPMNSADTAGHLDGYLLDVRVDAEDRYEADARVRGTLLLPALEDRDTTAEALGDPVLGSVKRGFGWVFWCDIEGLPVILEERTTGLTRENYTVAPRLVIDGSASIGWTVDRRRGIVACRPLAMGIHDPENALGWWTRARADGAPVFTLAADVGPTDTECPVVDDLTGVGAGAGYIGKEYWTWSGTDTEDSFHQLTGITRGLWGPRYSYGTMSILPFRQISQRPVFWPGRVVRLWAALIAPDGAPVGSAFGDQYSLQLYVGDIEKPPAYDRGTFHFRVMSLERRLLRDVGVPYQAMLDGGRGDAAGDVYVWVGRDDEFRLHFTAGSESYDGVWPVLDAASANTRVTLESLAKGVVHTAASTVRSTSEVIWTLAVAEMESLPDGALRVRIHVETNATGSLNLYITRTNKSPAWMTDLHIQIPPSSNGDFDWVLRPQSSPYAFVREPATSAWGTGGLPDAGLAVVEDDPKELIRYKDKTEVHGTLGEVWRLTIVDRGVGGSPRADLSQRGIAVRGALLLQGKPGVLMARLLASSGTAGLRGTHDVWETGYGLDDTYLDIDSFVAFAAPAGNLSIVPEQRFNFEALFGGLLAASWCAVGPVRVGRTLRVGIIRTMPVNGFADVELGDASLMLRDAAQGEEVMPGPSSVLVRAAQGALEQAQPSEFRVAEEALEAAKGSEEWRLDLYGVSPGLFFAVAPVMALSLLSRTAQFAAARLRCTPWHDLLPGLRSGLTITHPSLWDWHTGSMGLEGASRILAAERNLRTLIQTVNVLVDSQASIGCLCPGLRITGKAGSELTLAESATPFFVAGEPGRLLNPGRESEITDMALLSVNGTTVVVDGTPPSWVGPGTVLTYPQQGSGSTRQNTFVHHDDDSVWEF
ncbi:MAG: hypothetical protein AMXMBFR77_27940 [Phycisphaerales bacterium]